MSRCSRRRGVGLTAVASALVAALASAGCSGSTGRVAATSPGGPGGPGGSAAGPHFVVVIEENHSFDQIQRPGAAPNIDRMASSGTLLTSYFAIAHPSLPNYIALLSGGTQGITSDCTTCTTLDAPTLVDQLGRAGITWRAYMQGLPAPCSTSVSTDSYVRRHDPFMYFRSIRDDPGACRNVVPLSQFYSDLATGHLPQFAWITPDLVNDMHGGEQVVPNSPADRNLVQRADALLGSLYDRLSSSSAWDEDTRLVVTWDEGLRREGDQTESCCGGLAQGGHIATVVVGPDVSHGSDARTYTHYSLLRSIESAYGLPHLGHAADPTVADIPAIARR
ncbi:MAG: alkaline phosphatase family protein [Frankiaceae bacterium]